MTVVNVHAAKTNLSKLLGRAVKGEEVVIARGGEPLVRLVPVRPPPARRHPPRAPGLRVTAEFFLPLPPEELGDEDDGPAAAGSWPR